MTPGRERKEKKIKGKILDTLKTLSYCVARTLRAAYGPLLDTFSNLGDGINSHR